MAYFGYTGFKDTSGLPHGYINNDGAPQVCSQPYLQALAEGDISGHEVWTKNGYNDALSTSEETLWAVGGDYVFPSTPMQMEIVSSSANDASGGTGARTVEIFYLNGSYAEMSEIVTLNGLTPVTTFATDIFRVNTFRVKTVGTGKQNAGNIDIRHLTDTPIYSRIATGTNRAMNCVYTVPAGKELYIFNLLFSAGGNTANRPVRFITKTTYDNISNTIIDFFMPYTNVIVTDRTIDVPLECPTFLPATTDVKINAISPDGVTYGACVLRGWLETE